MKGWIIGGVLAGIGILFWYHSANEPRTYKNPIWRDLGTDNSGDIVYAQLIYYDPSSDIVHGYERFVYSKLEYSNKEKQEMAMDERYEQLNNIYRMATAAPYPNVEPTITSSTALLYVNCKTLTAITKMETDYASNSVVDSITLSATVPYQPDTDGAYIAKYLCKKGK